MFVILSSEGPSGLHGDDLRMGLLGDNHMCDRIQIHFTAQNVTVLSIGIFFRLTLMSFLT